MTRTIMVNLFGGPGTGKSSIAAGVFSRLKFDGIDSELVTEFAKDKIWEESFKVLNNQFYITAKQYHRIARVHGKVDVIVTDSPFVMSIVYDKDKNKLFRDFVVAEYKRFRNISIVLERAKKYNPNGRTQTESEARTLDVEISKMLEKNCIGHTTIKADKKAIDKIIALIRLNLEQD